MRVVDLFCGIGGFRLGLERADLRQLQQKNAEGQVSKDLEEQRGVFNSREFTCVWSNDNDRYACQIYRKHWGARELYEGDIFEISARTIPDHDLLCAGFPCQSFSIAGKRGGFQDTRGTLFYEICRIAEAKRTPYLFLENVKGLLNHNGGQTFWEILSTLDVLGYDCQWQVLNSKNDGVPQNRERVFIIGHLRGQPRPKVFPIGEADTVHSETDGERIVTAPITTENAHQFGKNVTWKQARDIATALIENQKIRRLTPLECERLQGFPDGWTEGISDTQRYKCLGNAVTVNVIEAIGKAWIKYEN